MVGRETRAFPKHCAVCSPEGPRYHSQPSWERHIAQQSHIARAAKALEACCGCTGGVHRHSSPLAVERPGDFEEPLRSTFKSFFNEHRPPSPTLPQHSIMLRPGPGGGGTRSVHLKATDAVSAEGDADVSSRPKRQRSPSPVQAPPEEEAMSVAGSDVVAELDALQMDSHRSIERTCGRSFYPRPRQAAPMLPLATKAAAQAVEHQG